MAEPPHQHLDGKFGKYLLGPCIRSGGMGVVFSGWTIGVDGFSQRVAIKRIHPEHSRDQQFLDLFRNEARLSSHLRHGNLVRVFSFDEDEAGPFMVMEYVDGVALDALLITGSLPLPVILFVIAEVLRGLAYMHTLPPGDDGRPLGIVHRDVSPHNVLLSWDGGVQIGDFGIAKHRNATRTDASKSRGKDQYMSPEQAAGLPLDGRSDVFVAGILLWEMFFGTPPLSAPHEITAHVPSGSMPRSVAAVLVRMLERRPEDRYSATAALGAIIACADYPKSGRDALATILLERLPHRVPDLSRAVPTEETQEPTRPLPLDAPGHIAHRMHQMRRSRRRTAVLAAITVAGALSFSVHELLGRRAAVELEQPVLDLPSTAEPLAPVAVRLAAPERAPEPSATELAPPRSREALATKLAPRPRERAPASPQQAERKPPEDAPTARPEAPPDFRVIELRPESSEPGRTGENPWIQP
jgi:serine/threonine-protein kinase